MTGEVRNIEQSINVSAYNVLGRQISNSFAEFLRSGQGTRLPKSFRKLYVRWVSWESGTRKGTNFKVVKLYSPHSCRLITRYRFDESRIGFRTALCDSFNTPVALDILRDLVSRTNVYINSQGPKVNVDLVESVAQWISRMLRIFGLDEGESTGLGWGQESKENGTVNVRPSLVNFRCIYNHG